MIGNSDPRSSSLLPSGEAAPPAASPRRNLSRAEREAETDALKAVDLFNIAGALGFEPTAEKGKMTHPGTGSTIVISPARESGHWLWIDNTSGASGSAFDLVMQIHECDFRQAAKRLRRLVIGLGDAGRPSPAPRREITDDAANFWFGECHEAKFCAFLNVTRGLEVETTSDKRFAGTWRMDGRKNAAFPYIAEGMEIVGVECRNRAQVPGGKSWRGYTAGGLPGVWTSRIDDEDCILFIVESPIDAMSIFQMTPHARKGVRFLALRSGTPDALVRSAIEDMKADAIVFAACDTDEKGQSYNDIISRCAEAEDRVCRVAVPPGGAIDWNEALLARRRRKVESVREVEAIGSPSPEPQKSSGGGFDWQAEMMRRCLAREGMWWRGVPYDELMLFKSPWASDTP